MRKESKVGTEKKTNTRGLGAIPVRPAAPPDVALFKVHAKQLVTRGRTLPPAQQILQICQNPAQTRRTLVIHRMSGKKFPDRNYSVNSTMDPRSFTRDFREFLQYFNANGVDYLVIGGHAAIHHGYSRATTDL